MDRILLTGASGFVGKEVYDVLSGTYDVTGTDIVSSPSIYKMDVTDPQIIRQILKILNPFDAVVHMAALVAGPPSERKPRDYLRVNVMGTVNVLEAMRKEDIPYIVFMSSWSTFGNDIPLPINETTSQNPKNPYGTSKVMAEKAVKLYSDLYGIKATILRPTMIYGPRQTEKNVVQQIVDCMETGQPFEIWGEGTHTKELLHVNDMAWIIENCLNSRPEYKIYVVGTENPLMIREVAETGQKIAPFPIKFVPSNKWVFNQRSDMTKIKTELGVDPIRFKTMEEGLRECLEYRKV